MVRTEFEQRSARVARAALTFVLLTLAALVLVPALVQRRVSDLRADIEAAEPARTMVLQLQYNLVREMASLSELLLSGDPSYRERYRAAVQAERELFRELRTLARELGPGTVRSLQVAERRAAAWHARVPDSLVVSPRTRPGASGTVREPALFEQAVTAAAQVDSAILATTSARRASIVRVERLGMLVTFALGALALLAAVAVARLYGRVRRFAEESERQRRESERALEETARANEARARLIRGVTHDVKNPLGAAKGFVELLTMGVKGPLGDEQREYLQRVQRLLDNALAIIADLLDMARVTSGGGLAIHPERVDAAVLVRDAVDVHRAEADAAGHDLRIEGPMEDLPVRTDPLRAHQVLGNLLSNAVKYTPAPGRISLRAELVEGKRGPRDGPWVKIDVVDSGPGIPPALRESIFDEFTRVDQESRIKGHGLGLSISRRIARLMGGELTVGDAPGGGAVFTFWLPVAGAPAEETELVPTEPARASRPG